MPEHPDPLAPSSNARVCVTPTAMQSRGVPGIRIMGRGSRNDFRAGRWGRTPASSARASPSCAAEPQAAFARLSLFPLKLHQPPPIPLVWPAFRPWPTQIRKPVRLPQLRPPLHAHWRFGVVLLRFGSRSAPLRQPEHIKLRRHPVQHQAQSIPHPQVVSRLHALAVDVHLAATHRLRGERACLEEPRTPQPFIDAVAV
jgi:hypothetical protein